MNDLYCLFIEHSVLYFGKGRFMWTCLIIVDQKVRLGENWEISKVELFPFHQTFQRFQNGEQMVWYNFLGKFLHLFGRSAVSGNVINLQCL